MCWQPNIVPNARGCTKAPWTNRTLVSLNHTSTFCPRQRPSLSSAIERDALRFQASGDAEIKTVPMHCVHANQADRCITLLHCAQRLTPWLLDTRGWDRKSWVLFFVWALRDTSTLPVGTWSRALDQSFRSHYNRLLRTSQSHYFVLRGKETNFFGSKFAIDSSTPLSKCLLLLYLTFKRMPKAKFWRCQFRSRRRCQNSTSGPITAKP